MNKSETLLNVCESAGSQKFVEKHLGYSGSATLSGTDKEGGNVDVVFTNRNGTGKPAKGDFHAEVYWDYVDEPLVYSTAKATFDSLKKSGVKFNLNALKQAEAYLKACGAI